MGIIIPKLRQSARGQECKLHIHGVCNYDRDTTVLAHLPSCIKGMGSKGNDFHAVFACSACHEALDQHRIPDGMAAWYCLNALRLTIEFWIENGYLVIPGVLNTRAKPPSKIMPRKPMTVPTDPPGSVRIPPMDTTISDETKRALAEIDKATRTAP